MRIIQQNQALTDLMVTVEQLFPESSVHVVRGKGPIADFRLVPGPQRPRLIVPSGNARAASDALRRPSANDSVRSAVPRRLLSMMVSSRVGRLALPYGLRLSSASDSITDYLAQAISQEVVISLSVGSARANRKPILNVHTTDGTDIGFAKVGLNPLTNDLVIHEHDVLQQLTKNEGANFTAPAPIHFGYWHGHAVLLMSSLRPDRRQGNKELPIGAAASIVGTTPLVWAPVDTSSWFTDLVGSAAALQGTAGKLLSELLDRYGQEYGAQVLPFAAWHGDFGPWNLARTSGVPMVWDWERYATGIPVGFDVIHFLTHQTLRDEGNFKAARRALDSTCRPALRQVLRRAAGISEPYQNVMNALVVGYLLSIATRFTMDSYTPGGHPVLSLADWHRTLVEDQLRAGSSAPALKR